MSTNLSKEKRAGLLAKIDAIRAYVAAAPQDENTGNLLAYLGDLTREVGEARYGLVFEQQTRRGSLTGAEKSTFFWKGTISPRSNCCARPAPDRWT